MSLIGEHENQNMISFLRVRMSPFDFILLPDKLLPGIDIKGESKKHTNDFNQAGFKIKKTLYLQGTLTGQLCVIFIV